MSINDSKSQNLPIDPQQTFAVTEQDAVVLSAKQTLSLYKKSKQTGIPFETLEEVYKRGFMESKDDQVAFNRVNSFIAGGEAMYIDNDLMEKRGLWDNIHAKRERIKHGSGERMRKPGEKGAPTAAQLKSAQTKKEEYTGAEPTSPDFTKPESRFDGTTALTKTYADMTPGQSDTYKTHTESTAQKVKRIIAEQNIDEDWSDTKHQDPRGGLKASGVRAYRRENPGSKLKSAVRTEPSKLKKGGKAWNRRKSFCARSAGQLKMWPKAAKDPNSRLRKARRAWNC